MIFVDTGAFLARWLARDQYHEEATAGWLLLESGGHRVFTSSLVLNETLTLLGRRATYEFAAACGRSLLASNDLSILRPGEEDDAAALEDFSRFADQRVSFADAVSFALMRRRRIRYAFTFDRHFALAGFEKWPA